MYIRKIWNAAQSAHSFNIGVLAIFSINIMDTNIIILLFVIFVLSSGMMLINI